jgi:hypothetical protein
MTRNIHMEDVPLSLVFVQSVLFIYGDPITHPLDFFLKKPTDTSRIDALTVLI